MDKKNKIAIFGGSGMLGSAINRRLKFEGYENIYLPAQADGFDLLNKDMVDKYIKENHFDNIFMVAGLVGGIYVNNTRGADFLYQNAIMILNVIEAIKNFSQQTKLFYSGSTCIYPKENPQPINEKRFLAGYLEETNKGYAVAKITGIIACQLYHQQYGINAISAMPTNMYGQGDNYNLETGHFIAALIKKLVTARQTGEPPVFWGSGNPRREALYSDDCAEAIVFLMKNYNEPDIVNIGTGFDYSIKEFVEIGKNVIGYKGEVKWDSSKPDGMYMKQTDISKLKSIMPDFKPRSFEDGLRNVLNIDFANHY
ncbi:MAG: GDP-L-fucose synthase [Ignavibacteria bacterium]|nr:GDP-L-fucose synthase [Ignavibacteria bacterium]